MSTFSIKNQVNKAGSENTNLDFPGCFLQKLKKLYLIAT